MKVRIGSIEISDLSPKELDDLIRRYGNSGSSGSSKSQQKSGNGEQPLPSHGAAADTVLLKKLVESGDGGVTTIDIGTILGRRGKAARPALREWAKRIGLVTDDNLEAFEEVRVGTQRGLRIKSSLLDVAKHILGQQ